MPDFASFLSTKPFTFFLGPSRKPIVVQSRLFQNLSDPLDARIPSGEDDGKWQNPVSEIEDVEWDVFAGLVEYAYTRDYVESLQRIQHNFDNEMVKALENKKKGLDLGTQSEPENDGKNELSSPVEESIFQEAPADYVSMREIEIEEPAVENDFGWRSKKKYDKKKSHWGQLTEPAEVNNARLLWQQFSSISKTPPQSSQVSQSAVKGCSTSAALLYHAKLCVLANRYLIPSLQSLCLGKLHKALTNLDFNLSKINAILDLVYFVYTEDGVQEIADLKYMVLLYVAAKIGILRQDDRLRLMMHDIGQLGADLVYTMSGVGDWSSS